MIFAKLLAVLAAFLCFSLNAVAQELCTYSLGKGIVYLPQFHWRPEFEGNPEITDSVARSQFAIAQAILKDKDRTVFQERLYDDVSEKDLQSSQMVSVVKMIFPQGMPTSYSNLNDLQKKLLAEEGAAFVLMYLGEIKEIRKTFASKEQSNAIDQAIEAEAKPYGGLARAVQLRVESVMTLIFKKRDEAAVAEVNSYLRKNPGKKIFLVFGGAHDFTPYFPDNFEQAKCPLPGLVPTPRLAPTPQNLDCESKLADSGLLAILKRGPKGFVINREAPALRSYEMDGPRAFKEIRYRDPTNNKLRSAHIRFDESGKLVSFLVQDEKYDHVSKCDATERGIMSEPGTREEGIGTR